MHKNMDQISVKKISQKFIGGPQVQEYCKHEELTR